ncbi:hypothetical protein P4284_24000 [Bacillus swezeyi]|uniref:hypothetical protein n=1 Tax=Bacillus swezeyi TaxID=1925020 RepID=UPI002E24CF53|nr:hypothetical protein [Bacillus swezeyi]MED2979717.1 hypothetical protein [Bacillus swezeyi]
MNKSEVLEIFEEVLEEWCSSEMTLISQCSDDNDNLERREKLFWTLSVRNGSHKQCLRDLSLSALKGKKVAPRKAT